MKRMLAALFLAGCSDSEKPPLLPESFTTRFRDDMISLKPAKSATGAAVIVIRNDSDERLANVRISLNRETFVEDYGIGPHDEFHIILKEASIFLRGRPLTHVSLFANAGGKRRNWHWDIPN